MNKLITIIFLALFGSLISSLYINTAIAADVVPNEIKMPGTQPEEVGNFESPDKCDNCHAGYNDLDPGAEPATGWRGGAMGNAGRDAIFWATLAVAEQDFDGVGDLCIRCHSAKGWYGGRSTPTDGSGLASSDDNGIDCDTCHASTNTNNNGTNPSTGDPIVGLMLSPFVAKCDGDNGDGALTKCNTGEGFYGSGMLSLWPTVNEKLGPYGDAEARHQWQQSAWHRDVNFCGSCHDVSNSAVGDLASNHGAQLGAPHVISSHDAAECIDENGDPATRLPNGGCLGGRVEDKAAFNNPPYAYGVVERTFSEYKASAFPTTRVGDYTGLPADLQVADGSLGVTYDAAMWSASEAELNGGQAGDYADGTPRFFSCQSCHMRPVGGSGYPGCNKNGAPVRTDLPRHDHTGGNYWFASITKYQDDAGTLRVGGSLNSTQLLAMDLGQERAAKHLSEAGSLTVTGNTLKVTNLTGHKLITGYPEGRRMWLNIKWYDAGGNLVAEDGEYGSLQTEMDLDGDGNADKVETILHPDDGNTKIYEAHYAITRDWAAIVQALHDSNFALSYDHITGAVDCTVGQFLASDPEVPGHCSGNYHNTFHFALNNYVSFDNRIPPYGMSYDEAQRRSALPVPADQYGNPGSGGTYQYWDEIDMIARSSDLGATSAEITLLYQGTSWEYNQFLQLANDGSNAFLGQEGDNMMDAWLNAEVRNSQGEPITGVIDVNDDDIYNMVPPVVMDTAEWGVPPVCTPTEDPEVSCQDGIDNDCDGFADSADADCDTPPVCIPTEDPEVSCNDGIDNDCDGLTDADDPDCQGGMACTGYEDKGSCNNDPTCTWTGSPKNGNCGDAVVCEPQPEICDDNIDNDCDGATDCADSDCSADPICQAADCSIYNGNETACKAEATCRWSRKNQTCLNR